MAELNQEAVEAHNPFQGPIPGQSLTNSPDSQQPWEQPPEVTGIKDGRELMFLEIIKEENLEAIVTLMNDGMSIAQITEMLLEVVGIEPKINRDDLIDVNEEELDEEETADLASLTTKLEQKIRNPKSLEDLQEKLEKTAIPRDIQERVEQIDFESIKESLLARSPKQEQVNDSLLQRK